jgi:hypothetical protein
MPRIMNFLIGLIVCYGSLRDCRAGNFLVATPRHLDFPAVPEFVSVSSSGLESACADYELGGTSFLYRRSSALSQTPIVLHDYPH